MELVVIVLLVLAAVCFVVASVNRTVGGLNPVGCGLTCWALAVLLPALGSVLR